VMAPVTMLVRMAEKTNAATAQRRRRPKFKVGSDVGARPPKPPPTKTAPRMANERTTESTPVAAPRAKYTTKNGTQVVVHTPNRPDSMSENVALCGNGGG